MFASVLINSNAKELNRVFDYVVPEEIKNSINIIWMDLLKATLL